MKKFTQAIEALEREKLLLLGKYLEAEIDKRKRWVGLDGVTKRQMKNLNEAIEILKKNERG